jgi:hypothetical protein
MTQRTVMGSARHLPASDPPNDAAPDDDRDEDGPDTLEPTVVGGDGGRDCASAGTARSGAEDGDAGSGAEDGDAAACAKACGALTTDAASDSPSASRATLRGACSASTGWRPGVRSGRLMARARA